MGRIRGQQLAFLLLPVGVLAAETDFSFMPPGGRTILADLLSTVPDLELREIVAREASREDWQTWASGLVAGLDEKTAETFAGYAALNFPLDEAKLAGLAEAGDGAVLPPDGKDLAIAQCQFCHSLFSGYLMQRRDRAGWEGTFKAPFHAEIPMTEVERATFAEYSAINMPLAFEDVPPELRF